VFKIVAEKDGASMKGVGLARRTDPAIVTLPIRSLLPMHTPRPIAHLSAIMAALSSGCLAPVLRAEEAATTSSNAVTGILSLPPGLAAKGAGTLGALFSSGGMVMIPLAALSVVTLALILVYLATLRRGAVAGSRYMTTAETLLAKGDTQGLLAVSERHRDIAAVIMSRTLGFLAANPAATDSQIAEIAQTEGNREAALLNQRVAWLADIATIAPMLGLLGTVFGMIRSFAVMANDVAASRPMLLAEGVAEALVATAAGLLIGIPAMAAYAWFRGRVQEMISEMEGAVSILVTKLVIGRGNRHRN
jgi:biopolymer transport protein ExbB